MKGFYHINSIIGFKKQDDAQDDKENFHCIQYMSCVLACNDVDS